MFQAKVVEKIKTHILCSVTFSPKSYRLWDNVEKKNIVEQGRPQMTIWCMRIACWIPKATDKYWEYLIIIAFPLQQWLYDCVSVLRYTYSKLPIWLDLILHHSYLCILFPVMNGRTAFDDSRIIIQDAIINCHNRSRWTVVKPFCSLLGYMVVLLCHLLRVLTVVP